MAEIWPTHGPTAPTNTQTNTRKHRAGAGVTLGDDLEFKFWAFYAHLGRITWIWADLGRLWPPNPPTRRVLANPRPYGAGAYPCKCVEAPYRWWGAAGGSLEFNWGHLRVDFGADFGWFWGRFGPKLAAKPYHAQWIGQPMAVRPHHTPGKDRGSTVAAIWDPLANVFGRSE